MTPLSLQQWMETRPKPLSLATGRCITLATDGRSVEKDNPLGLGLAPLLDGSPTYIFVQGADPNKVLPYTGVSAQEYGENAVGEERFYELLREQLQGVEFFVGYWAKLFIGKWFKEHPLLQGLAGMPIFDVVDYVKLLERNESIMLASANTWEELVQRLSAASPAGKGYGFEAVYNRITGLEPVREGEIFKGRLLDLKRLFGMLLVR